MRPLPLLLLIGCGGAELADDALSGLVECRGLTHSNLVWRTARSVLVSYDPVTEAAGVRCNLQLSAELSGGEVTLVPGSVALDDLDRTPDRGSGWIYADGTYWELQAGTLSFDTYDDTLAEGSFRSEAVSVDASGDRTGRTATLEGPFSWCEGTREDCPFRFDSGLSRTATIDSPVLAVTDGGVTACRMLVDRQTGALQVDLQLGSWGGASVGQLWVTECGGFGTNPPQGNLLTFRAGGVDGPGSFGPFDSAVLAQGVRLPMLAWVHPATFYGNLNQTQACMLFYPATASVQTVDGSSCSFEIDATGNRFHLGCEDVLHSSTVAIWPSTVGSLTLDTDCDYLER